MFVNKDPMKNILLIFNFILFGAVCFNLQFVYCSHDEDTAAVLSVSTAGLHGLWSVSGGRGERSRGVQLQYAQEHAQSSYTSRLVKATPLCVQ